jgi:hypothetical protein
MELLESSGVRPRQARYQAALRPDMKCTTDSKALSNFSATEDRFMGTCRIFHNTVTRPEQPYVRIQNNALPMLLDAFRNRIMPPRSVAFPAEAQ